MIFEYKICYFLTNYKYYNECNLFQMVESLVMYANFASYNSAKII